MLLHYPGKYNFSNTARHNISTRCNPLGKHSPLKHDVWYKDGGITPQMCSPELDKKSEIKFLIKKLWTLYFTPILDMPWGLIYKIFGIWIYTTSIITCVRFQVDSFGWLWCFLLTLINGVMQCRAIYTVISAQFSTIWLLKWHDVFQLVLWCSLMGDIFLWQQSISIHKCWRSSTATKARLSHGETFSCNWWHVGCFTCTLLLTA